MTERCPYQCDNKTEFGYCRTTGCINPVYNRLSVGIERLPSAQPETEKYEYHYDHTDCIWQVDEAMHAGEPVNEEYE